MLAEVSTGTSKSRFQSNHVRNVDVVCRILIDISQRKRRGSSRRSNFTVAELLCPRSETGKVNYILLGGRQRTGIANNQWGDSRNDSVAASIVKPTTNSQ